MGYKRQQRRRKKDSEGTKWIFPTALAIVLILLIISSIRGKSPSETVADVYYWVVGSESPDKSRAELKSKILSNEFVIDSLYDVVDELKNKSPYRTAIVKTSDNSLNLRSEPNLSSEVVIKIPDSSAVKILYFDEEILILEGETGKWCKIKYADKEGWVWGNYLELQD